MSGQGGAEAGAAGEGCLYPEPVIYPAHCFDHVLGDGETGLDCGGGECSACAGAQTCVSNDGCLSDKCSSGQCQQVFDVQYTSIVTDAFTRAPKFRLVLNYLDSASILLRDIRIRYYFNHDGVSEPVLGLNSQATFDPGNSPQDLGGGVQPRVYRSLPGPAAPNNGRITDSYLEIAFDSPFTVITGSKLDITQDFVSGSSDSSFEQISHYSFFNGSTANENITIYVAGKRIWGIEPPWLAFPECAYAAGVNVNGDALTVDGEVLDAAADASLTFDGGSDYANSAAKAFPATDVSTTQLLTSARTLTGTATGTWPVPNGKYYVFAWLTSASNKDSGVLTIQGSATDKFVGLQDPAPAWALLGPYSIVVSDQKLALGVASGFVHVAGLKLYRTAD